MGVACAFLMSAVLTGCAAVPIEQAELSPALVAKFSSSSPVLAQCAAAHKASCPSVPHRAGHVYLLRGWLGVFSTGMDELADQIRAHGVEASVHSHTQWLELAEEIIATRSKGSRNPIILIGHSYGADDIIPLAQQLGDAGITVDLMIPLDAVMSHEISPNVRRVVNIFQSNPVTDGLPFLRGLPVRPAKGFKGMLINADVRTSHRSLNSPDLNHFTIDKAARIQAEALREVIKATPLRKGGRQEMRRKIKKTAKLKTNDAQL